LVTQPKPFVCHGGPFSWWDVTISGRLDGKQIHRAFSTCWTPQMATLGRLGMSDRVLQNHLLPRRHETVLAGAKRIFPSGVVQPADLITCDIRGHRLSVGVPTVAEHGVSTGFAGTNTVAVNLAVTRHADGSVTAACLIVR
jgi:hypothetical protein